MPQYWLLKTEPSTYSFDTFLKQKKTNWNDVRNFQARNSLKAMEEGDVALIYHSGDDKAVVGTATVSRTAYKDPDPEDAKNEWVQVDLKVGEAFAEPVTLATIKSTASLKEVPLIRQSRLSVMPITPAHFKILCKLGGLKK